MKYTLDEIYEIISDPSFDDGSYGYGRVSPDRVMKFILDAVDYHNKISNDNNAEKQ